MPISNKQTKSNRSKEWQIFISLNNCFTIFDAIMIVLVIAKSKMIVGNGSEQWSMTGIKIIYNNTTPKITKTGNVVYPNNNLKNDFPCIIL